VFGEIIPQFEVHILEFNQNIYNKSVEVILGSYIRDTIKFDSIEDLKKQITEDIKSIIGN
jgi:riboflavin kinase/FMN adenylyltransferase